MQLRPFRVVKICHFFYPCVCNIIILEFIWKQCGIPKFSCLLLQGEERQKRQTSPKKSTIESAYRPIEFFFICIPVSLLYYIYGIIIFYKYFH